MNKIFQSIRYRFVSSSFFVFATGVVALLMLLPISSLAQSKQPKLKDIITAPEKEEVSVDEEPKPLIETPAIPRDELGRGTPRTSFKGFYSAAKKRDYETAAQYLDLRNLPKDLDKSQGPELARHLKIILDRTVWVDLETLSNDPSGHSNDGLPLNRDRVCRIKMADAEVDILLQRISSADEIVTWKFSSATIARTPELYERYGYGKLDTVLPEVFFDFEFMGIQLWLWISLAMLFALAYLLALIATLLFTFILSRTKVSLSKQVKRFIALPVRLLLALIFVRASLDLINPTPTLRALLEAHTLFIIVGTWVFIGILDYVFNRLDEHFRKEDQHSASLVLLPPIRTAVMIILIVVAAIIWLDNIGFKVTTLLAGLGVGSIAVALAAQKSIENLIGAITLYTSKPVSVGDFCKFGDMLGIVEEIGLRATRVRTLDNSIVTVPNAVFVNLQLDNFTQRKKILYRPKISLRYDTSPDQIRFIIREIKKLLSSHPRVLADPARVRFTGFGTYSLDLDIFAYIDETRYTEYLEIAEDINLKIMDIVSDCGLRFAIPSQTTYLESGTGLDGPLHTLSGKDGKTDAR